MGGGSSRVRPYCSERCKKISLTNIDSLSNDLLFNILVQLPAHYLYDVARLVCRRWYRTIHTRKFESQHRSTSGLLIQGTPAVYNSIFVAKQQGRIETSDFAHKFKVRVWASCNGLVLQSGKDRYALYVANPATKQLFKLPPIRGGVAHHSGIAFAANSMKYKVVHTFQSHNCGVMCAILTVGIDKSWRRVNIDRLHFKVREYLLVAPLATDGFMHWIVGNTRVLTLNVETEIITEISVPRVSGEFVSYSSSESCLSLFVHHKSYLEVWEMEPEIGKWVLLQNVDVQALKKHSSGFIWPPRPVGWLKYGEVLMLYGFRGQDWVWIAYNLHTKEIDVFELGPNGHYKFLVHRNSLAWFRER